MTTRHLGWRMWLYVWFNWAHWPTPKPLRGAQDARKIKLDPR